jgi:hypothetical protein
MRPSREKATRPILPRRKACDPMLSRGLRIFFGVGIVIVVLALGLHAVLRYYNAPPGAEYDLLNVFAATFASTILTFFIGALLFDYQVQ